MYLLLSTREGKESSDTGLKKKEVIKKVLPNFDDQTLTTENAASKQTVYCFLI